MSRTSRKYLVCQHDKFKGAIVRILKRLGSYVHTHSVLVETMEPHDNVPTGERFEIDMRNLKLNSDTKWNKPYELKKFHKPRNQK